MRTITHPDGTIIQFAANGSVENSERLPDVWTSPQSIQAHKERLQQLADERNGGEVGNTYRYASSDTKEWHTAPSLKVWWTEDHA